MNDRTFYRQLKHRLELESVVLATIVKVVGSAPREVGAKMAVCADRSIIGTIGGGAGEGKVIERALAILKTEAKQLVEIDLTGTPGQDIQGVCGGKVQVWLEKWSGEKAIALVTKILELFTAGQSAELITPLTNNTQPYLISDRDLSQEIKNFLLSYGHFARCVLKDTAPHIASPLGKLPYTSTSFVETIQPPPILLIIGGGHVAVALAQIASFAGFQIAVQDDRPEFVTLQRFPQALFLSQSITETLATLTNHARLYVTLVTRGYQQDLEALQAIAQRSLAYQYIGAIGSQKRIRKIHQALQHQGISLERLPNFYAPIGLDIGALTPEEIAVSICGELIKVRRGGTGLPLCERMQHSKTTSIHVGELLYARSQIIPRG